MFLSEGVPWVPCNLNNAAPTKDRRKELFILQKNWKILHQWFSQDNPSYHNTMFIALFKVNFISASSWTLCSMKWNTFRHLLLLPLLGKVFVWNFVELHNLYSGAGWGAGFKVSSKTAISPLMQLVMGFKIFILLCKCSDQIKKLLQITKLQRNVDLNDNVSTSPIQPQTI